MKPGISGILKFKNEAEYAKICLESIADYFDELILVYHECTDETPEILTEFEKRDPKRIHVFHYVPHVHAIGSKEHRQTPITSVNSFVHYSNFALSKASCEVRCVWGADQVAEPVAMRRAVDTIRGLERGTPEWWFSPWRLAYWWYIGVNLWLDNGEISIHGRMPIIGNRQDHAFFPAGRLLTYKRYSQSAYLFKRVLKHKYVGCLFYHLKGMKQHRGSDKYGLEKHPDSLYRSYVQEKWVGSDAMTLEELKRIEPRTSEMPPPESLGIRPAKDSQAFAYANV
jgi:hypothetical protein